MTKALPFYQVDAFTAEPFSGNPAAVFIIDEPLSDQLMQSIATEMNLSETAFVLQRNHQNPLLRWFTPFMEIDLCGHATLASAHIYLNHQQPEQNTITFDTKFVGPLTVTRHNNGYTMDFPARPGDEVDIAAIPPFILDALTSARPIAAYKARDLMLIYDDATIVEQMTPNFTALSQTKQFIIVSAKSNHQHYDFISRFFCADDGIAEDPVTGSAHCTLGPYWAQQLGKNELSAYQASKRGGELHLVVEAQRVKITGQATTVITGTMTNY